MRSCLLAVRVSCWVFYPRKAATLKNNKPEWLDPGVFGIAKRIGRTLTWDSGTLEGGFAGRTPFRQFLDGQWPFQWYPFPSVVPENWADPDIPDSIATITVPGVMEFQGYGTPYYLAFDYPPALSKNRFRIPSINPKDNPVGIYRCRFNIPSSWSGRTTFIHFGGVKSAFYCFINGMFAGYSQGSMTPAEFEITPYLKPGENLLAVKVLRYSDGTYLEDQDMWFLSGIFRSVSLFSEPIIAFSDFHLLSTVTQAEKATLSTGITFVNRSQEPVTTRVRIYLNRESEGYHSAREILDQKVYLPPGTSCRDFFIDPGPVDLWCDEMPHLYRVIFQLLDECGESLDCRGLTYGFREVRRDGCRLLVNHRQIFLKGVNRHDYDPDTGWALSPERYLQDIRLLKGANINAVRTSHYPNDHEFLRLCDQFGLYVMDETDLETHGVRKLGIPGRQRKWQAACVDRIERMVLRDRNHPSVILWSLGNEAGFGPVFAAMKQAARICDDSRPFHYEGDRDGSVSDCFSRMYAHPDYVDQTGRREDLPLTLKERLLNLTAADNKAFRSEQYSDKPLLFCEFAHSMGNSLGNFGEFIDRMERYDNWLGGFVWDFVDQAVRDPQHPGNWLYGGDFGEVKTSGTFCANGIISADRKPHPAWFEVRKVYQPVSVELLEGSRGIVRIRNKRVFLPLHDLQLKWEILRDGRVLSWGEQILPMIHPGQSGDVTLAGYPERGSDTPGEYVLDLSFHPASKEGPSGFPVAREQFVLYRIKPQHFMQGSPPAVLTKLETSGLWGFSFNDNVITIDKESGLPASIHIGPSRIILDPQWNFFRPPTDNDLGWANFIPWLKILSPDQFWRRAGGKTRVLSVKRDQERLLVRLRAPGFSRLGIIYSPCQESGGLKIDLSGVPRREMIRFGFLLRIEPRYRRISWYGKGPHENYPDRCRGAFLGEYRSPPEELVHRYMRPQENGLRTGIRHLELTDDTGAGFRFETGGLDPEETFHFSLQPWSLEALERARHWNELVPGERHTLCIDGFHRGVGGDYPGQLGLMEQYRLLPGREYRFSFRLVPVMGIPLTENG